MNNTLTVRAAEAADVDSIHALLELYTKDGTVLPRSKENISFFLGNFSVAELHGKVCGCVALRDFGGNLLELRSLVVDPGLQSKGIGRAMVEAIISGLRAGRAEWRLFTLTKSPGFFRRLGFTDTSKEVFPEKIWSDCSKCPKFDRCDECALVIEQHGK